MRFKSKAQDGFQIFAVTGINTISFAIKASAAAQKGLMGFAVERSDPAENQRYYMYGFKVFKSVIPHPDKNTSSAPTTIRFRAWCETTSLGNQAESGRRRKIRSRNPLSSPRKTCVRGCSPARPVRSLGARAKTGSGVVFHHSAMTQGSLTQRRCQAKNDSRPRFCYSPNFSNHSRISTSGTASGLLLVGFDWAAFVLFRFDNQSTYSPQFKKAQPRRCAARRKRLSFETTVNRLGMSSARTNCSMRSSAVWPAEKRMQIPLCVCSASLCALTASKTIKTSALLLPSWLESHSMKRKRDRSRLMPPGRGAIPSACSRLYPSIRNCMLSVARFGSSIVDVRRFIVN
jgi:hypothetical protein